METKQFLSIVAFLIASVQVAVAKPQNSPISVIEKYNKYFGGHAATTTSEQNYKEHIALLTTALQTCMIKNNKVITTRQAREIPGTDLKTRTFYKLSLQPFGGGGVTWTTATNSTYHYINVDNGYPQSPRNNIGGGGNAVWSQDYDWEFIPVLHNKGTEEAGWYGLKNRGRQGEYLSWANKDYSNGGQSAFHMVLDKFQEGRNRKEAFHLKPVKARFEGRTYYQLKLKDFPDGAVTWTEKQYGTNAHFIQVDNSGDRVITYKQGGDWYKDTLFVFEESGVVEKAEEEELGYQ